MAKPPGEVGSSDDKYDDDKGPKSPEAAAPELVELGDGERDLQGCPLNIHYVILNGSSDD